MAKFTEEHKQEMSNNYFEEGIHKVKISSVTLGKTGAPDFKEYMEFGIVSEDGEKEDNARLWFTTDGAIKYSFNTIKSIFVHNSPEDKKQKARDLLDKVEDTTGLEKMCQALIGKEAWYSVQKSTTRTYTANDGTVKPSYDRNITGYEPKPKTIQAEPVAQSAEDLNMPKGSDSDQPFGF